MHPILTSLQSASSGLLVMSESDYPFEIVYWPELEADVTYKMLQESGKDVSTPIETITVEYLLRNMTKAEAGAGIQQQQTASRFVELQQLLNSSLENVKVYRVGTVQVDVFIIGKLDDGTYGGLKTKLIET
jgi:hypothetical protein